ncbi:hypothetical protein NSA47_02320 [Irregularibacter muris]|uniref:Uncharacterized protein n=1 Tax=Irregularibacter muris TaxID=1796619 RepID=A0AAE3HET3_9FIRM|nr:hypothetical protein [Irregularibacter muris]MCR1897823.1 hypothetical protein [Irregularibacter muris]
MLKKMRGAIVDYLEDKYGNYLFPRTITEAVADKDSGKNLNQMLDGIVRCAGDETEYIEDLEEHTGEVLTRHDREIKNLESAKNELRQEVDEHKAESMTQLVGTSVILANISSGSKTYIGPFQKPPKRISIMARINDTPSANWGEIIESNAQYRMSQHSSGIMTGGSTNLISLSNTTGGSVLAVGSIEPDGRLELTWQKTGTITEAAIIYTTAMFHGGE